MSKNIIAATMIAAAGILFSCSGKNTVSLSYTNARGEVPQLGNLVFRFNQPLVKDSMLHLWDSAEYISFEPKIPGRFRWDSPDQLVFSPAQPLAPATTYKASIRNTVLKFTPYDKITGGSGISFRTPNMTLDDVQVIWMLQDESEKSIAPQVNLFFNYRVDPADVKNKLQVQVEGEQAAFTMLTASPDNKISLVLSGIKAEDKNYSTRITLEKGLKPENGRNATAEPLVTHVTIPSPYVLNILNIESGHDGIEGIVKVFTSQQLPDANIKSFIRLVPDVKYTVNLNENGFELRSDKFDSDKSYQLTILKDLRGRIGGLLKENYYGSFVFGELQANIRFSSSKAVYLSKKGSKNLEVQITNVPKVKIVISKIYENNLLMAQRYGYYPQETRATQVSYEGDYYDEGYYYDDYDYGNQSNALLGDVIFEKELDTRLLPQSGAGRLLNMSLFEDRIPDFNGIYHVMIRSANDYWVKDSRFIAMTDLGLVAKEGQKKIFVFANSIKTAQPVSGANISVYAVNNQLIGSGATNKDGVAEIDYVKKDLTGFSPALIIAKTADDFNYLPFHSTRVNTSRFDVGGKRINATGLDAFIYAERDIYRPGERVNFAVVIRDGQWKSPGPIPVKMKFLLPNGKELKTFRKTLNEEGAAEGNVDISTAAITGSYTLELYSGNDVLLASKNFSVEEFVPDRIKVNVKLDRNTLKPGEKTTLHINAVNFFGPPAAHRNYETEIQIKQKYFSAEKFNDYDFGLANPGTTFDKIFREGKTDAEGNASEIFEVMRAYANSGVLQANFYTTVFDETGRPVSRLATADIFTQDVFFGIRKDWFYYYPLNQPVKFMLAAVNKNGNATSAAARVEIIKREYRTVLSRYGSYFRYESQQEDKLMMENKITVSEGTVFTYVPRSPGDYELRVYVPGSNSYVSKKFYSYGGWGSYGTAFEVNTDGQVDIELDKKSYFAGETVKALFKTPFSGRLLVTLETDRVLSYQYVDVKDRTASLDLRLHGEHVPNTYITATLIKPHEASDIPLTVAHGFQNVKVEEKSRRIDVAITAQKSVRSKTKQKIKVKAAPNSFVTLAAVDNGVLQVTDFKTPDPYNYFYQKRALQVSAYDLYPLLFAEVRARLSSSGGDAEAEMKKRVNPMPAKRIKILSYWSGLAKTNSRGEADFELDIPQFSGEIRLMAVTLKGQNFGSAESTMTVADPLVISTALPRFLSPGDTVTVPVTLSNTTAKAANVSATISAGGPLQVIGENTQSTTISANSEGRVVFQLAASPEIALANVKVTVNGMGETFTDETEISVRPPSTLQKITGSGSVEGNSSRKITIDLSDFISASTDYALVVSRSPVVELADHLRYLVQYPYGCTEQTISAAFPQLYYGDMADLMQLNAAQSARNANSHIMEAIRKIKMRQLYNGAVTMWDGGGTENWWTTVYAAHFLLEAKKAGFDVDNSLLETMLSYLNNRLKKKELITYYYNRSQNKKIAPKEVAYSLYVLSLAGRNHIPSMNYYKANPELLALDSRYLLSAAFAAAGDKKSFNALLPSSFSGEESVPQSGGSFYSDVRDEAIALNALIDADPGHAQIPVMAKHVSDKLKSRQWLSTQERAFAFLALGKLARSAAQSDVTADIKTNGKVIAKVEAGKWRGDKKALKSNLIEIVTKGNGRLYYFWHAEGISSSGDYREVDNYLKVRKRFYDRFGNPLTGSTFKQNDLIVVGITLERSFSTTIENVVITDLLPAGFEIENPRTKDIPGMDWINDASTPTALDVRDDRIHFFVDADRNRQVYYYAIRAVSPGIYKMGPVSADAMYNGEYHSYHGAGWVRVVQ